MNEAAAELAVVAALLLNCEVNPLSRFVRKTNASPYLPGGYQITQLDEPVAAGGRYRGVRIDRIQLEEDAAKPTRAGDKDDNRAGVPLLEIVTYPDVHCGRDARDWAERLHQLMRFSRVTDGRLERGALRMDANVSVGKGEKVEIKGLASFGALQRAIDSEIARQRAAIAAGDRVAAGVAHWSEKEGRVRPADDAYAYAMQPAQDVPPLRISDALLAHIRRNMGEDREQCIARLCGAGISARDAERIACHREAVRFLDRAVEEGAPRREALRLVLGEVFRAVASQEDRERWDIPLTPRYLARVSAALGSRDIDYDAAKAAITAALQTGKEPPLIKKERLSAAQLDSLAREAIDALPEAAGAYKGGREKALSSLIGYMARRGADAKDAGRCLKHLLVGGE